MKIFVHSMAILVFSVVLLLSNSHAESTQEIAPLRAIIEAYVQKNTANLTEGEVEIQIGQIDPRTKLAQCPYPEAFLPGKNRFWGNTWIGIRCQIPSWSILVPVQIKLWGTAVFTSSAIQAGARITETHVMLQKTDLTQAPTNIFQDLNQVLGRTMLRTVPSGALLRSEWLKPQHLVHSGEKVKIWSQQGQIRIAHEGIALQSGGLNDTVKIKLKSGGSAQGIVQPDGSVAIP